MPDFEQVARAVDGAVEPVTAEEAIARAGSRTPFRRTAVAVAASVAVLAIAGLIGVLAAFGVGRHSTVTVVSPGPPTTTSEATSTTASTTSTTVPLGAALGRIDIPSIDVHWTFVQGDTAADEDKGPVHDPQSPMPGERGRVIIAGHRTTHGAPFFRLDELETKPGAEITLTTLSGEFTYVVDDSFIVPAPGREIFPREYQSGLLNRRYASKLWLVAYQPKYSAAQNLVITAHLR
jgi:LPXTG-site transpeptidase (sortase) family protein